MIKALNMRKQNTITALMWREWSRATASSFVSRPTSCDIGTAKVTHV